MIGSIVGNYRITEHIGEGGMGAVYKGVDLMLEREVAIKALRPELARQPELLERFRTEAITLAKLNHQNIATLYSFFCHNDEFFMVMEFVRGETLDKLLQRHGPMRCERALPLFLQALAGIEQAHAIGVIHRDIKPANIMVNANGTVKVMDFGIARVLGTNRMTRQGYAIGTLQYMSPEQIRGEETDARSDIYSLGILLYEMLTGHVPFRSNTEYELMRAQVEETPPPPATIVQHIPKKVEEVIMRALAKGAVYRYQTAAEFHRALTAASAAIAPQSNATAVFSAPVTRGDLSAKVQPPTDPNAVTNFSAVPNRSTPVPASQIPATQMTPNAGFAAPINQAGTQSAEQSVPPTVRFDSGAAKAFGQSTGESNAGQTVRFDPNSNPNVDLNKARSGESQALPSSAPLTPPTAQFNPQVIQSTGGTQVFAPNNQVITGQVPKATGPEPIKRPFNWKLFAAAAIILIILGGGGVAFVLFGRKPVPAASRDDKTPAQATVPSEVAKPVDTQASTPTTNPAPQPDAQPKSDVPSAPAVAPDNTTASNDTKAEDKSAKTKKKEETAAERARRKKAAIDALDH
ncbi:MAG TPA: protein kinase [Blastocatellia bacterium]|nr:protein kinase [Blastocatellia bacterium]